MRKVFWRRRLPHWIPEDAIAFVTWRLAGTLPRPEPALLHSNPDPGRHFVLWDRELDRAREGPQWLANASVAASVVNAIFYGERVRRSYDLFAFVVMPNHVHVVLQPYGKLSGIMRWIKTTTAVRANRILERAGQRFWQREYFDHWIRTSRELARMIEYTEANPVKAGFAGCAEAWPWSSASKDTGDKIAGVTL